MADKPLIYMDYAAATPVDEQVVAAMEPYLNSNFYNPSATYRAGQAVRKDLEAARARVAHWFGARPSEIIFTAGATEANNLAIHGIMSQYPKSKVIVSAVEHDSVLETVQNYPHELIPVNKDGQVDLAAVRAMIDDRTVLISLQYANNEIGTLQPVKDVASLVQEVRRDRMKAGNKLPLYLHSDAAQAAGYLDLHATRLGADLISINGSKIYGPKQNGALYVRAGLNLKPLVYGGGQERGLRSGTENVAGSIGLATALDIVQRMRHEEVKRLQAMRALFIKRLRSTIPQAIVNGSLTHRLPNNVHITIPGQDNERLLFALDEAGILAAAGSACSASEDTPSHVLRALGLSDSEAQASLRFTFGRATTAEEVERVVSTLAGLLA